MLFIEWNCAYFYLLNCFFRKIDERIFYGFCFIS